MESWNVGRNIILGIVVTFQLSILPTVVSAQRHSITFEDYIALKSVSDPQFSPDGKTLAFISTREGGAQVWLLPVAGGDARKVSSLPEGASDPLWMPDGNGLLVTSDIKWPASQEIDQRNGQYPTDARLWTNLLWRHWDDWRAGKRQHVFLMDVASGKATDLTPLDHDVPTIATGGDGDVAVAPDGRSIATSPSQPVAIVGT